MRSKLDGSGRPGIRLGWGGKGGGAMATPLLRFGGGGGS